MFGRHLTQGGGRGGSGGCDAWQVSGLLKLDSKSAECPQAHSPECSLEYYSQENPQENSQDNSQEQAQKKSEEIGIQ